MPEFGRTSRNRLLTCDLDIQSLFLEVVKHIDCSIICGLRTTQEQQALYAQGRTTPGPIVTNLDGIIKRSRHQVDNPYDLCRAVDAVPYPIDWNDRDRFYNFIGFVRGVASQMNIPILSGSDWDSDYILNDQSFYDLPHWELK